MKKRTVLRWCALVAFFALTVPVSQAHAQQLSPSDTAPRHGRV